jgi:hypothetical protein
MGDGTNGHKHAPRFEFTAARNASVDPATAALQLRLP